MPMSHVWLTAADLAARWQLSKRQARRRGLAVRHLADGRKFIRWRLADIAAWERQHLTATDEAVPAPTTAGRMVAAGYEPGGFMDRLERRRQKQAASSR
jgi:hypothetical protein